MSSMQAGGWGSTKWAQLLLHYIIQSYDTHELKAAAVQTEPTYYFKWSVPSLPCRVSAPSRSRPWIHFTVGTKSFIRIIYSSCLMTSLCGAKNLLGGAAAFALLMETSGGKHTHACPAHGEDWAFCWQLPCFCARIARVVFLSTVCRSYCKVTVPLSAFIPSRHIFMFASRRNCLHLRVSYTSTSLQVVQLFWISEVHRLGSQNVSAAFYFFHTTRRDVNGTGN